MQTAKTTSAGQERTPASWYQCHGSRCLDWMLLLLLLPPALPLMMGVGLVNWILFGRLGRVFFLQSRIGWKGRPFRIIKFRTMSETASGELGSWSSGQDHLRVTRFGRFLRNTHFDELPQLFNVMIGEMSFIGPRPEMVEIEAWATREIPGFSERLSIRPGIAGLAQITQGYTGRCTRAYAKKLEINLHYIDHMSLLMDLGIVFGTMRWMIRGKGWRWPEASTATATLQPVPRAPESSPADPERQRAG